VFLYHVGAENFQPLDLPVRAGMYPVRVHHFDGSLMQDVKVIKL